MGYGKSPQIIFLTQPLLLGGLNAMELVFKSGGTKNSLYNEKVNFLKGMT